jgi:hypothetical protein
VLRDLADVANNFTGAGRFTKKELGTTPLANALFFSPRKIAATVHKFNPQNYLDPRISKTARKEAFKNLIGMVGVSSSILGLAAMSGADVEIDPRSSDFGKVQIGDTRFDVTGGDGNYLVLLARIASNQRKSTTSDIVRVMGEDYGAPTRWDTFTKFLRNKLSPAASFVADWAAGKDAIGQPFELKKEAVDRVTPLIIQTAIETYMEDPSMTAAVVLSDMFGFGASTYDTDVDWNQSKGKELLQFKEKVGQEKFDKANEEYNKEVDEKMTTLLEKQKYQNLSDEDKLKTVNALKRNIKSDIYKKYKFKYKVEKPKIEVKKKKIISELAK